MFRSDDCFLNYKLCVYVLSVCEVHVYRFRLLGGVNVFSVSLSSTYCVSCGLCLVLGFFGGGGDFFLSCA